MSVNREAALREISDIVLPDGRTLEKADLVRAFSVDGDTVRFVLEVADAGVARSMAPVEAEAKRRLEAMPASPRLPSPCAVPVRRLPCRSGATRPRRPDPSRFPA